MLWLRFSGFEQMRKIMICHVAIVYSVFVTITYMLLKRIAIVEEVVQNSSNPIIENFQISKKELTNKNLSAKM